MAHANATTPALMITIVTPHVKGVLENEHICCVFDDDKKTRLYKDATRLFDDATSSLLPPPLLLLYVSFSNNIFVTFASSVQ